jgi:hypothetical protein
VKLFIDITSEGCGWVEFDDACVGDVVVTSSGQVGQKMFSPCSARLIRTDDGQEIPVPPCRNVFVLFSPTKKGTPTIEATIRKTINETLLSEDFRKSFTKGLAQDILDSKAKAEAKVEAKVEAKAEAKVETNAPDPGEDFRLLLVGETIKEGDERYDSLQNEWKATAAAHFKNSGSIIYRRRTHTWRPPTNEDLKNGPVPCRGRDADHFNWGGGLFVWKRPTAELFPYIVSKGNVISSFKFCEIRVPVE